MQAKRISLARLNPAQKRVGSLDYVAGFDLTSSDPRLGGLSGLDLLPDGRLLAVSDEGELVWIALAEDGVTPASIAIAPMRSADGGPLGGKEKSDAEGLSVEGGLALVSFERDHRVLAFNLDGCGAAARGVAIRMGLSGGTLAESFARAGIVVGDNAGAEALAVTPDWVMLTGIETRVGESSPVSARAFEAAPEFDLRMGASAPELVGLDVLPDTGTQGGGTQGGLRVFSLHRGFSPGAGPSISVVETGLAPLDPDLLRAPDMTTRAGIRYRVTSVRRLADMGVLLNIDNFEGVAATELEHGRTRLFLISDNNFSERQRTLLMVFDLAD